MTNFNTTLGSALLSIPQRKKKRKSLRWVFSRMTDIENTLIARLTRRDLVESNFKELFRALPLESSDLPPEKHGDGARYTDQEDLIDSLKRELRLKEEENAKLKEIIKVMNRDKERVNDELISLNIENNVMQEKLDSLTKEHDKLIQRWLQKVQAEIDKMNSDVNI